MIAAPSMSKVRQELGLLDRKPATGMPHAPYASLVTSNKYTTQTDTGPPHSLPEPSTNKPFPPMRALALNELNIIQRCFLGSIKK